MIRRGRAVGVMAIALVAPSVAAGDDPPWFRPPADPAAAIAARGPAPVAYKDAKVAYYAPGADDKGGGAWNRMQLPLPAEESLKHLVTPEGFEARLFAAEPDVVKPIAMS